MDDRILEETYEIHIDDDELVPDNLDSLGAIEQFLNQKSAKNPEVGMPNENPKLGENHKL